VLFFDTFHYLETKQLYRCFMAMQEISLTEQDIDRII